MIQSVIQDIASSPSTSIEHLEKIVNTELCDGEVKPVAVETFLLPPHNPVPHHPNINIEAKGPKCR